MKTKSLLTLALLMATTFGVNVSANTDVSTETNVADDTIKVETITSAVKEPFMIQSDEPTTSATTTVTDPIETNAATKEPVHASLSQIRIIPFTTTYVADETVAEGQEVIVQNGVDGRESVVTTYLDDQTIVDVKVLTDMVPQIVHINPNDIRVQSDDIWQNAKPIPEPQLVINPFDKQYQPIPEPTVTGNPFETPSSTTTVTSTIQPTKVDNVEPTIKTKMTTLPNTGQTSNPIIMIMGVLLLTLTVIKFLQYDLNNR